MQRFRWLLVAIVLTGCAQTSAPEEEPSSLELTAPTRTEVESELYSTELVMDHQAAIGLTEEQRSAIRAELQETQRELVDAEIELRARREALVRVLSRPHVDETSAMEAASQVADGERAIKLAHMRLLIRIKNHLTEEQQRALDRLRPT